jgi:hypothetical protein
MDGNIAIDKIVAKRKRKRLFNGSCRDLELVGMVSSDKHTQAVNVVKSKIHAVSSMNSEGAYFFITHYNHKTVIVYFEPDTEILNFIRMMNRKAFL